MSFREKIIVKLYNFQHRLRCSIHELKHITIELTKRCNLQCKHCYMESSLDLQKNELTLEKVKQIADEIKGNWGTKISIGFTGGEVFMRGDIFEIFDYFYEVGFNFSLVTNGMFLSSEKIKKLEKYMPTMAISLDGTEKIHNNLRNEVCFVRTLENIKKVIDSNLKLPLIKTTITKESLPEIGKMYDILCEIGIEEWQFFTMKPNGRGAGNQELILSKKERKLLEQKIKELQDRGEIKIIFDELGNQKIQKFCSCGISSFAILYNGDVVHCIDTPREKRFVEGNVCCDKMGVIWKKGFRKYRDKNYVCANKKIKL